MRVWVHRAVEIELQGVYRDAAGVGDTLGEGLGHGSRVRDTSRMGRSGDRSGLFAELGLLYLVLDFLLLDPPLLVVSPPHGSFILALDTQVTASLAHWFVLITLLSSKTAGKAT